MKYTVKAIENAKPGMKWEDIGCHWTLGQAYLYSKEAGNDLPNFAEVIWDNDIETILADCRKLGIKEFTISSTFSSLIETIARFEELGCTLDGIVKVRERYTHFGSSEHALIPAFKMTVKEVWKKANPSLGITVGIDKVEAACESAKQNPGEENSFRQLRLNQWVKQAVRWMPMDKWDDCAFPVNEEDLEGRVCYGGLDLSSTTDITAFVLVFPPLDENDKYEPKAL